MAETPIYNIKAVATVTGIAPDTLRAWERRYKFLQPQRTETGRRLYTEQDLQRIRWLKQKIGQGLSVGQAGKLLLSEASSASAAFEAQAPRTTTQIVSELLSVFEHFDEAKANALISEALSLYSVEAVCLDIFSPVMVEVGLRWHAGTFSIAAEHFATNYLLRKVSSFFAAMPQWEGAQTIITACAPGEPHQLGISICSLFLQRAGWNVTQLGADMPVEGLVETILQVHPVMVCLSATLLPAATTVTSLLEHLHAALRPLKEQRPLIALGGLAFLDASLPLEQTGTVVLPGNALDLVAKTRELSSWRIQRS